MMDPARFAEIKAIAEAKRAARALSRPDVPEQPRDIFAEYEQEQAEARALSLFGSPEAVQAFVDEVEQDAKTGRRFSSAEELMEDLDRIVAAQHDLS